MEFIYSPCVYSSMDEIRGEKIELFDVDESFLNGNTFKNTYVKYKNYKPKVLKPNNEQEKMMLEIQKYSHFVNDLKLHLDIYPNDKKVIELFKQYVNKMNKLMQDYALKYNQPLVSSDSIMKSDYFSWVNPPSVFEN